MDEGRRIFAAESAELLEEMESSLLSLEGSPEDHESVNSLFRAVHTIKGSSGIVGLDPVEAFAHIVEGVLDRVREGEVGVGDDLIALLLRCRDHMAALIDVSLRDETPEAAMNALEAELLSALGTYLPQPKAAKPQATPASREEAAPEGRLAESEQWHISLRFGPDVLKNGLDPISFLNYLPKVGEVVSLTTLLDRMPPAEEMDPEACYLGFEIGLRSEQEKQTIEDVFEFVREDCEIRILAPGSAIQSYVNLIEGLPEDNLMLGEILIKGGTLTRRELEEALNAQFGGEAAPAGTAGAGVHRLGDILLKENMVHPRVLDAALKKQSQAQARRAIERQTIRVDTEKLDQMINMVGELVIAGANVVQHAARVRDKGLMQSVDMMTRLVEEVRERAMRVRMVQLHDTFNRFRRVVHDIARDRSKEIDLFISGGETEMDKTVIEKIKDPLMHIIRNAGDHGIERPEERAAAGKPARGTIRMNAYQETSDIVIEVSDDGRGLDREVLLRKALALGMAREDVSYTDREVSRFLFEPGFSTAAEVTNISGRGVGMDVVRRNIESLRGTVDIISEKGAGTTIRIRLPLTLAIIEGFLTSVGDAYYVIPMDMVLECLELSERAIGEAHGRHHVNLRGSILPYVKLTDLFSIKSSVRRGAEHVVVVRYAGATTGIVVDRLYGEIQAVIKDMGRLYRHVRGIGGATILGDGTVALILDVKSIVQVAMEQEDARFGRQAE